MATDAAVQLGAILPPALDAAVVAELRDELAGALGERYPNVRWELTLVHDRLVEPPVNLSELIDAIRDRLLVEQWDLVVCVTDLPLRLARRPLLTHASPTHGVALVSLPALGVLRRRRRLLDAVVEAVGTLIGDERRLGELAADVDDQPRFFLTRVVSGNIRLLLGMIAANQPWRLVGHLSRALIGALAATSFALVTSDVWRIAVSLDPLKLSALALGTIAAAAATLIAAHGLWEQAPDSRAREQVVLFNLVTLVTVVFGVASLYAAVFIVSLAAAGLLIETSLLASAVHHDAGFEQYLRLAWLASSLATVGGALGATVETDAAVREAAYAYRAGDRSVSGARLP
jgi:uncharacterized membrane protein